MNGNILDTLKNGPATLRVLVAKHGKGSSSALQILKADGFVVFRNREWHAVSTSPTPEMVAFLKGPHHFQCIAVDTMHTDIEELSKATGIPIVREYRGYQDYVSARRHDPAFDGKPFLIWDSLLWFECQNWEQAFQGQYLHVWKDRHLFT